MNLGLSSSQDATMKNYFSMFPEELIASILDAFIINRPMIGKVGGDGFWVHQAGESLYVALFDCMGHGHLASMMTRIYAQTLEKIVKEQEVEDPGTVLRYLHHNLQSKFEGRTNLKIGPGADVGLIKINLSVRKIEFSGAKTDLIQVVDGKSQVIKSARLQIGEYFDQDHDYTTTQLTLDQNKTSNFYLCSDGLKDLIGGEAGKKLGKKRMFDLLEAGYGKPMVSQKVDIMMELNDWQGNHDPLDDLLLIGFSI